MKYIVFMWITLSCFMLCRANLPPMDPSKPVYQQDGRGFLWICKDYREVKPLTAEELKEAWKDEFTKENRRKMWDRGFFFLTIGLPLFCAGLFMSAILIQYGMQMIAHFLAPTGITFSCAGLSLMQLAELWVIVTLGSIAIIAYGTISYLLRNKGKEIKIPFRKRKS